MNIQAITLSARAQATIIPADPLATGTYQLGSRAKAHDLSEINQLFAIKCSGLDNDVVLDLDAGTAVLAGAGSLAGGDGDDADGQPIDINEAHVLHLRNTGLVRITATIDSWTGGDAPFTNLDVPAGGEAMIVLPEGEVLTAGQITFSTAAEEGAFEFLVMGKK